MTIFREEAIQHQSQRLHGTLFLSQPVSLSFLVYAALALATAVLAYLATASFARKETVSGWIYPQGGVAEIYATRSGVGVQVLAKIGQQVKSGQTLGIVTVDVEGTNGPLANRGGDATRKQIDELQLQITQARARQRAEVRQTTSRVKELRLQVGQAETRARRIAQQIAISRQELDQIEPIVARGFITTAERNRRLQVHLSLEESADDAERMISSLRQALAEAEQQAASAPVTAEIEASQLRSAISSLDQSLIQLDVQARNVFKSPIDGVVAYSNLKPGQAVAPNVPLFAVTPTVDRLEAVLLVPTRSIGFVRTGQKAKLMIDSYPYQHYGTIDGYVAEISKTALTPGQIATPVEIKEPYFRIFVRSYGKHSGLSMGGALPLRSGMTLRADVVVDRRKLSDWLLDPIVAASKRALQ